MGLPIALLIQSVDPFISALYLRRISSFSLAIVFSTSSIILGAPLRTCLNNR